MDVKEAIIKELRRLSETRDLSKPIGLYAIGVPLVSGAGFDQRQVVNALFSLEREGLIEILPENALRLTERLII